MLCITSYVFNRKDLATTMDTKQCRHCRQPIDRDARLCQFCHGYQSWLSSQRDPRFALVWIVIILLVVALFVGGVSRSFPDTERAAPPSLTVTNVSTRMVTTPEGQQLFVLGDVHNLSPHDAVSVWFRVRLLGEADQTLGMMLCHIVLAA